MLILLPPSEGKAAPRRRGAPVSLESLSFPELADTRKLIMNALIEASGADNALEILGVGASLAVEVEQNRRVDELPAALAADVFTGVLFEALDLPTLSVAARRRAARSVLVQSALWGPVSLRDKIAPYRLSMSARLPGLDPLASMWRAVLDPVLTEAAGSQVVVDCRSSTYAAAWQPRGEVAKRTVSVRVFSEQAGKRTVVSHFAKHTRGLVARWLLEAQPSPRTVRGVADIVSRHAQVELTEARSGFTLDVIVPG